MIKLNEVPALCPICKNEMYKDVDIFQCSKNESHLNGRLEKITIYNYMQTSINLGGEECFLVWDDINEPPSIYMDEKPVYRFKEKYNFLDVKTWQATLNAKIKLLRNFK